MIEAAEIFPLRELLEELFVVLITVIVLVEELLDQEIFPCSGTVVDGIAQIWP